jgi:hypothetical protein
MDLNWTTLFVSAITSAINGVAMFLSIRYVSKIADRFDRSSKNGKDKDDKK